MFVALDLETTGFDPENDKIIEFGAIRFDLEGNTETLQFLINPEISIPQIVTHITKIKDEDVKDAPKFDEKLKEIQNFIQDFPIIGHNIQFDTGFLKANGINLDNPEYDTFELASILAPGLPSYSLEILSEIFQLKHTDKHRALDDAIASMELFLKLAEKFQELPKDLINQIHSLSKKTNWPLKNFLLELEPTREKPDITPPKSEDLTFQNPNHYKDLIDPAKTALFEESYPFDGLVKALATEMDKNSYLALSHDLFHQIEQFLPDSLAKIDTPRNYISLARFKKFQEKEFFENHEFTALLKYLIWSKMTKTGLLSELKIVREEKVTINQINIDENIVKAESEDFFKKAIEKDQNSPAICTHQYIIDKKPKIDDLIIMNFDKFIRDLHFNSSKYLKLDILTNQLNAIQELTPGNQTIESLLSKSTILFGLIGMMYQKYNDRSSFTPRAFISNLEIQTKEWGEIEKAIKNLIEISKELGEINDDNTYGHLQNWKNSLKNLHEIFVKPNLENNMIWIEEDFLQNIIVRQTPNSLKPHLQEILANCKNYKIVNENLDLNDNATFTKNLFGLDPDIPLYKDKESNQDLKIFIADDVPERENNEITLINHLVEFLHEKKGKTALIFNSKQKIKHFTLELSKKLTDIQIISQLTGSLGKLIEKFKQNPDESILLVTPNFWERFKDYHLIDTLFIHKLPFDPPSDPYIVTNSQNFRNPFVEFQIPRATFALIKSIERLPSGTAIILDPRIITKPYGKAILDNLTTLAKPEITNLASLHLLSQ